MPPVHRRTQRPARAHQVRRDVPRLRGEQGGQAREDSRQDHRGSGRGGLHQRNTGLRLGFKVIFFLSFLCKDERLFNYAVLDLQNFI